MTGTSWVRLGAILGFLAVAIGAFGAHGLKDKLESLGTAETFQTGVNYHMFHTIAILAVGLLLLSRPFSAGKAENVAGWAFLLGLVLFSGSLYILSVTGIKVLGAITPFGGVAFLVGWVALAVAATGPSSGNLSRNMTPHHSVTLPDGGPNMADFGQEKPK